MSGKETMNANISLVIFGRKYRRLVCRSRKLLIKQCGDDVRYDVFLYDSQPDRHRELVDVHSAAESVHGLYIVRPSSAPWVNVNLGTITISSSVSFPPARNRRALGMKVRPRDPVPSQCSLLSSYGLLPKHGRGCSCVDRWCTTGPGGETRAEGHGVSALCTSSTFA